MHQSPFVTGDHCSGYSSGVCKLEEIQIKKTDHQKGKRYRTWKLSTVSSVVENQGLECYRYHLVPINTKKVENEQQYSVQSVGNVLG